MPSSREILAEVLPEIHAGFASRGWRKRSKPMLTLGLNPETLGVTFLNWMAGRQAPWLQVNPIVGVRHQVLEKTLAEINGEKFRPYAPGTIAKPLGYLMPQRRFTQWTFTFNQDPRAEVEDLLRAIDEHGLPFLRSHASLEAIVQAIEREDFFIDLLHYDRLPVAYFLLGNRKKALALVERELRERNLWLDGKDTPQAQRFRDFAKRFKDHVAATGQA